MTEFRMHNDNPDVARMLKAMDDLGMNQTTFGDALGIPQPSISRMLSGVQRIYKYHLLAVEVLLLKRHG